jgi:hypothetical protein
MNRQIAPAISAARRSRHSGVGARGFSTQNIARHMQRVGSSRILFPLKPRLEGEFDEGIRRQGNRQENKFAVATLQVAERRLIKTIRRLFPSDVTAAKARDMIGPVTIRDYIRGRFRTLALVFAVPYAVLWIARIVIRFRPDALPAQQALLVLRFTDLRVALVFMAWFAFRVFAIRCPRCARPLGGAVATIWGAKSANRCPHCRVSLDEPVKPTGPL